MDIAGIILTIAACIAGLFILWGIIAGTIFFIASKRAKAVFDDFDKGFDSDFFKRNRR